MFIGIDTSCYTTGIAVVDDNGKLLLDKRRILKVEQGERGLSQSAALFQHVREGKDIFAEAVAAARELDTTCRAICVSSRPRPQPDSYMPVFLAGVSVAELLGAAFGAPVYQTSHQEGHLMAGLASAGLISFEPNELPSDEWIRPFLAVHLSGGTSELLLVEPTAVGFRVELLGGSVDLQAGQLIDRTGVALGLEFPCGKALDELAVAYSGDRPLLKSAVSGFDFSLSGGEAELMRQLARGGSAAGALAQSAFDLLARSLAKVILKAAETHRLDRVLLVGGVSGSDFLRVDLTKRLGREVTPYFAPAAYAKDNAYGVALLGLARYRSEQHLSPPAMT